MDFSDLFDNCFGDQRLDLRARAFVEAMSERQNVTIRQIANSQTEAMGYYRMLNNEKVLPESIIDELTISCSSDRLRQLLGSEHVLVMSDSSEINFQKHAGRIKPDSGLGRVGNNHDIGLFVHTSLAVSAGSGRVFGYSDIHYWTRQHQVPTTHDDAYKQLPIELKESYRWISTAEHSKQRLAQAKMLTVIADAEADIYQEFTRIADARTHLLIASRSDRRIAEGCGKLYAHLQQQPVLGEYSVELEADRRKKHPRRQARLIVRAAKVHLLRPTRQDNSGEAAMVAVYALSVQEHPETVLPGHSGVEWVLLTTHQLESFEQAREVIGWYVRRWNIEQLFRLLKRQGMNVESSQLEDGTALIRLTLLSLAAILRVLVLLLARDHQGDQQIGDIFNEQQQACLGQINQTLRGSSRTSSNPEEPATVGWALWIIARLGGWKALKSERPPGPITLFRGLTRFEQIYHGWALAISHQ